MLLDNFALAFVDITQANVDKLAERTKAVARQRRGVATTVAASSTAPLEASPSAQHQPVPAV